MPFFLVWPGRISPGSVSIRAVGLVDVMPTLLDLIGLDAPKQCQGAVFIGPTAAQSDHAELIGQLIGDRFSLGMIRIRDSKFIRCDRGPSAGREELYDLRHDPREQTNLVNDEVSRVASLRVALDRIEELTRGAASQIGTREAGRVDETTLEALRALGYLE